MASALRPTKDLCLDCLKFFGGGVEGALNGGRFPFDDFQEDARRAVWCPPVLFPISEGAEGNTESLCKLRLSKLEFCANRLDVDVGGKGDPELCRAGFALSESQRLLCG